MTDRMQVFSRDELSLIHDASMDILSSTGLVFHSEDATDVFKKHGYKTDGFKVHITEKDVLRALETVPSLFRVYAPNPEKDVLIGENHFVFLPTTGSPNISTADGERRPALLSDYHTCVKMVQTSEQLDMNGWIMVQPNDLSADTFHLDLLFANLTMCDKGFIGPSSSKESTIDAIEMAAMFRGGIEQLREKPIMTTIINAASPLRYSREESESIITMSEAGQPLIITDLVMAGSSGPISLPGLLALANAEILGGVVLSQLVRPGEPIVFGSVSAPADMRTITSAVGAPEAVVLASATVQIAKYYNLPCRTGGMLTNAHIPDSQAAAEGVLIMSTAVRNGANFINHSCGQIGSYLSMNFEKWIIDEEVCAMIRRVLEGMRISVESIDVETIKSVGCGGNYLTHATTFEHCRDLYQPKVFTRDYYNTWQKKGSKTAAQVAGELLKKRLESYRKPDVNPDLEKDLAAYVDRRKREIG